MGKKPLPREASTKWGRQPTNRHDLFIVFSVIFIAFTFFLNSNNSSLRSKIQDLRSSIVPQEVQAVVGTINLNQQSGTTNLANFSPATISVPGNSFFAFTSGNVGIGTTAPSTLFELKGGSADGNYLATINNTTSSGEWLRTLGSGGNVGISLNQNPAGGGRFSLYSGTSATASILIVGGDNEHSYFNNSGGNVGIGTTNPGAKLDIVTTGDNWIRINDTNNSTKYAQFGIEGGVTKILGNGNDVAIRTDGGGWSDKITIKNSGNVGIGASNPERKLDIWQTTDDVYNGIGIFNAARGSRMNFFKIGDVGYIYSGGAGELPIALNGTGNVGIGTTNPGQKLEVAGNSRISNGARTLDLSVSSTVNGWTTYDTNNYHRFQTDSVDRMVINDNLIGIGTTAPGTTLDVNGTARATSLVAYGSTGTDIIKIQPGNDSNPGWAAITVGNAGWTAYPFIVTKAGAVTAAALNTNSTTINGTAGRNYFKDSEKSDGNGLRVGAAWGMYGVYSESGAVTIGSVTGAVNFQNGKALFQTDGNWYFVPDTDPLVMYTNKSMWVFKTRSGSADSQFIEYQRGDGAVAFRFWTGATLAAYCNSNINACGWGSTGMDYAETMPYTDKSIIENGDLIIFDTANSGHLTKSSGISYDPKLTGIVSTAPGFATGTPAPKDEPKALADRAVSLAGRVPTKITSVNGFINSGDPITSSPIAGVGMKATKAGQIVGKSMDNTSWNEKKCPVVASPNSIPWPDPIKDHTNAKKPCFRIPVSSFDSQTRQRLSNEFKLNSSDYVYIGKVMVFVSASYHNPDLSFTSTGDLKIESVRSSEFVVRSKKVDSIIDKIGAFAEIVVAKIQAGVIETKKLIVNGVDVMERLNQQQKEIDELKKQIELLKK